jgi:outer membrane protein assembly factor BamB
MVTRIKPLLFALALFGLNSAHADDVLGPAACEGGYPRHLQGICTNGKDAIYWSWTDELVKTDTNGRLLKKVPVANHHGDLCYHDGRVYVATNLAKFNRPAGEADSWVYVYHGDTLAELGKYPVPELVHGAGGMEFHNGKFFVAGGLPPGTNENYVYEYDGNFQFQKRHVLASGYTLMGIQTITHADGTWWFGCYGKPAVLLSADENFTFSGKWEFNASVGIAPVGNGRFLIATNKAQKDDQGKTKSHKASVAIARADKESGMTIQEP